MIELDQLHVEYSGFTLGPLSFAVSPGERVALVGPNGAGKSTTLRALTGLLHGRYSGAARISGREVSEIGPEVRCLVGLLPERLLGFGWMTVREHLAFLSRFYPRWDEQRVAQLVDRLELPIATRLANLSKGNQVKLSLVAVEGHRPPIILLDEPTSGIDPMMRDEILSLILEAVPIDGERTVIFSSHILEDVEAVADRVLLLRDGVLIDDLSLDDMRRGDSPLPIPKQLVQRLRVS